MRGFSTKQYTFQHFTPFSWNELQSQRRIRRYTWNYRTTENMFSEKCLFVLYVIWVAYSLKGYSSGYELLFFLREADV